jgi:hypothetical protein
MHHHIWPAFGSLMWWKGTQCFQVTVLKLCQLRSEYIMLIWTEHHWLSCIWKPQTCQPTIPFHQTFRISSSYVNNR